MSIDEKYKHIQSLILEADFLEARKRLESVQASSGNETLFHRLYGIVNYNLKNWQDASEHLGKALASTSADESLTWYYLVTLVKLNEFDKFFNVFNSIDGFLIVNNPKLQELHDKVKLHVLAIKGALAKRLFEENRFKEALTEAKNLLKIDSENNFALNIAGLCMFKLSKYDEAVAYLEKIKGDDDFALLKNLHLAQIYKALGSTIRAELCFLTALELAPESVDALYNAANFYSSLKNFDKSRDLYMKVLEINPNHVDAINNLGICFENLGDKKAALETWYAACQKKLSNKLIIENLFKILTKYNDQERARNILEDLAPLKLEFFIEAASIYLESIRDLDLKKGIDILPEKQVRLRAARATNKKFSPQRFIDDVLANFSSTLVDTKCDYSQIFRGKLQDLDCANNMNIYFQHSAIARECRNCFKVQVNVESVANLLQLDNMFRKLEFPIPCIRKTMVETRNTSYPHYKGFLYFRNSSDANLVVRFMLEKTELTKDQIIFKRGCSEFYEKFPLLANYSTKIETFDTDEWDNKESIYRSTAKPIHSINFSRHGIENRSFYSLKDLLIIRNWLTYAKQIDDTSILFNPDLISKSYLSYLSDRNFI